MTEQIQTYMTGASPQKNLRGAPAAGSLRVRAALVFVSLMTAFVVIRSLFTPFTLSVYLYVLIGTVAAAYAWWQDRLGREPRFAFAFIVIVAAVGHLHSVVRSGELHSASIVFGVLWPAAGIMLVGRRFGLAVMLGQLVFYTVLVLVAVEGAPASGSTVYLPRNPYALFTSTVIVTLVLTLMLWYDDVRQRLALARAEALAEQDYLTGLNNRAGFDHALADVLQSARAFGLLAIDLDHFKLCNDNLGHDAGDQCLHRISVALRSSVRGDDDFIARTGGDEFAALLPGVSSADVVAVANRMRKAVEDLRLPTGDKEIRNVTVTIGVAYFADADSLTARDARQMADKALYLGKREGRNRVRSLSAGEVDAFHERSA